ncbi:MAG: hypothetical protein H6728_10965 [Myxococcales bacterium]|nr:hypothetical protein [Myxococcales bacterium]
MTILFLFARCHPTQGYQRCSKLLRLPKNGGKHSSQGAPTFFHKQAS